MGKKTNNMAELGNALKMPENLGSGTKIRHGRETWNIHFF